MLPSRLTVYLFVLSLASLPIGILFPPARWLVGGYYAGVFCLFLLDGKWAASVRHVRARRNRPARLSLGAKNEITIALENPTRRSFSLMVRDAVPPGFPAQPDLMTGTLPGYGTLELPYQLLPTERGDCSFGNIYLRCRGPLGLAWKDHVITAEESVAVYPNLLEVRRYEALVRATLVQMGGYRTRRRGGGREFSHFRDYTPDDDYRDLNWKATARRGKPITTVYESEHGQDVIFCLDVGRMMAARVGTLTKLDHAINAVLMLTHVSQSFQDNVGLLVFSHTVHRYLPPTKGRAQHAQFLQALYSVHPELCYANYHEAFNYLLAEHPKRALTMVFTDLLDRVVSAEYQDAIKLLRQFHLPLTLAVADVPLQNLAAQTPGSIPELYDVEVARDLLNSRTEMLRSLERQGVLVLDTVPERLTIDAVNRYMALKTSMQM